MYMYIYIHSNNRVVCRAAWLVSWSLWSVLGEVFPLLGHQVLQTLWRGMDSKPVEPLSSLYWWQLQVITYWKQDPPPPLLRTKCGNPKIRRLNHCASICRQTRVWQSADMHVLLCLNTDKILLISFICYWQDIIIISSLCMIAFAEAQLIILPWQQHLDVGNNK